MKKFFLLLLLFSSPVFAADSTSYAPPGVVQNTTMDRHGTAITNASTVRATGDIRTPVLYDSDNTGYYVNPNGVSRLNDIRPSIIYDGDNTAYYVNPNGTTNLNTLYTQGNIIAPRMYDRDSMTYYADPASTSRLNSVNSNNLTAGSITLGGVPRTSWPGAEGALGATGWTKLPNGLIIQRGLVTTNAVRYKPFPIPFPNACVSVQVTANRNSTSATSGQAYTVDRFGANMVADITHGPAWWMALGY